jgi:hypothetical protein
MERTVKTKTLNITTCKQCPHFSTGRTEGAGFAIDYFCHASNGRLIRGYIEYTSEDILPGEFPVWCPLKDGPET